MDAMETERKGARHNTEVAFTLLTQPSWFQVSHLTAGKFEPKLS